MTIQDSIKKQLEKFREEYRKAYSGILPEEILVKSNTWFEDFIAQSIRESVAEALKECSKWMEHSSDCILSYLEEGEQTPEGGYRQKIKGVWYQTRPIDETPKCDCGLSSLISNNLGENS